MSCKECPLLKFKKSNIVIDEPHPVLIRWWEIQPHLPEESLPALQGFTEVLWSLRHLGRVLWFLVYAVTCMVPQEWVKPPLSSSLGALQAIL